MSRKHATWALSFMNINTALVFAWVASLLFLSACDTQLTLVNAAPDVGEGEGEAGEGEGESTEESFCSLQPVEAQFPVKVLYAIDVSGSTQFTDQAGQRVRALQDHIAALAALDDPDISVALLGWGAGIFTEPQIAEASDPRFTPVDEWDPVLPSFIAQLDVATDTHAALGAVYDHILSDATRVSPEERLRTRYVVIFVTDGESDPRCCVEEDEGAADPFDCPLEPWEATVQPDVRLCEGKPEQSLCNEEDFLTQFRIGWEDVANPAPGSVPNYGVPFELFADFELGGDRNRIAQLEDDVRLVNSIAGFGVGAVDTHFFLIEDTTLSPDVNEIFQLNPCRLHSTIDALADAAGNTSSIGDALALDFSALDVTPLCP